MSAPALVGNALVLHSLCYSIAPLPCFPPLFFPSTHPRGEFFFRVILFVCTRLRVVCTQGACGLLPGPITMHFNTSPSPVKVLGVGVCPVGLLRCTRDEV
jgi:hypothetical protein